MALEANKSVIVYVGAVGALSSAAGILGAEPPVAPDDNLRGPRSAIVVDLTVVPSDERGLACVHAEAVAGLRCEFSSAGNRWEDEPPIETQLQPYMTLSRQSLLGAGLWSLPGVRRKLAARAREGSDERFVTTCRYTIVGSIPSALVRWRLTDAWRPANGWLAGRFESCEVP